MTIFVPAYWPLFTTNEQRRFDYAASDGSTLRFTSVFFYDAASNSMLYKNYDSNGNWLNTWLYQYRPGFGIAESQDQYPQSGVLAILFGPVKNVTMSTPMGWGEWATVGNIYANSPVIDFFRSRPPQFGTGMQYVLFEELLPTFTLSNGDTYSNVLVFYAAQVWNGKTDALRFWMAMGIGPVAVQFMQINRNTGFPTETVRFDRISRTAIVT